MNLLKTYYEYMQEPAYAVHQLLKRRSFTQACWGYFAAALGLVLFFNIGNGISIGAFLFKLLVLFCAALTTGYLLAAMCSLFLDLNKVHASPAELFVLFGTAGFINGVLIALALISAILPLAHLGCLAPLALLLVFALQIGYLTRGIMRAYDVPAGTVLVAWIFSVVPLMLAVFLLGVFFIWGIVLLF